MALRNITQSPFLFLVILWPATLEGGTTPAEASGLRLPLLMATFLTGRFGKSMVALQVNAGGHRLGWTPFG